MNSLKIDIKIPFRKYFRLLREYLKPEFRKFLLLIILLVVSTILSVVNPQILKRYIESASDPLFTDFSTLILAAVIYITLAIIAQILLIASVYIGQNLAWDSTNTLRYDLLNHCMHLDMRFHNEHKPGSMVERIDGDVLMLSTFFSTLILYLGRNLLLIISILIGFFILNWIIGLAFLATSIAGFYFIVLSSKPAVKLWTDVREAASETYGYIEERITGKEDLLALGARNYTMMGFHKLAKHHYEVGGNALMKTSVVRIIIFTVVGVSTTLVYILGKPLFTSGVLSIAGIYLIADYTRLITNPIINIGFQIQELQRADAAIDRTQELLSINTRLEDKGKEVFSDHSTAISFNNISFEYKENEPVLHNLSLEIEKNTIVGLVGRTGSGKTTLSRLLFRLYDPTSGNIQVGGKNIKEYPLKELRRNVAMVTQTVELFQGTLRDNITLFDRNIADETLINVINDVGLGPWLTSLEKGLDTEISASNSFSAGEAQLIAFTRVFLRDPKIVVLDEASSRLDPYTEVLVDHAVEKLLENRTAIIIAHRLATLNKVDTIAIMENGVIIEQGKRTILENNEKSKYAQLLKTGLLELEVSEE